MPLEPKESGVPPPKEEKFDELHFSPNEDHVTLQNMIDNPYWGGSVDGTDDRGSDPENKVAGLSGRQAYAQSCVR